MLAEKRVKKYFFRLCNPEKHGCGKRFRPRGRNQIICLKCQNIKNSNKGGGMRGRSRAEITRNHQQKILLLARTLNLTIHPDVEKQITNGIIVRTHK